MEILRKLFATDKDGTIFNLSILVAKSLFGCGKVECNSR